MVVVVLSQFTVILSALLPEHLHHPKKEPQTLMSSHPTASFLPQLLVSTNLPSISVDFPKWPHYVAFCAYFLLYVFTFYPCCSTYNTYSLLLPDIPLYNYATFCVSIHQLMDICAVSDLGLLGKMLL